MEKNVFVPVAETILTTRLEFTMLSGSQIIEIQDIFREFPPMYLEENARAKNLLATKIIVSVSELVYPAGKNANVWIAETENLITTIKG